jgi:putative redox protein
MTAVEQPTVGARSFETGCGRQVRVGTMILGDSQWSALRVSVDIGACPGCGDGTWVTFTTAEARQLAGALLAEAAAAEHPDRPPRMPAGQLAVTHADGDSYTIVTRGHTVLVDQPIDAGGADTAATPTEMFVGSLASCVAFYAGQFLQRHGLDRHGLSVSADFTMAADRPARVAAVRLRIAVPDGVPAERRAALLAVASHCTVHNTVQHPPAVHIELS